MSGPASPIEIQAGPHTVTAADLLPADLSEALHRIHRPRGCALTGKSPSGNGRAAVGPGLVW